METILGPASSCDVDSFVVSSPRFLQDLERSFGEGFRDWILAEASDEVLVRAAPRLLEINPRSAEGVRQYQRARAWNKSPTPKTSLAGVAEPQARGFTEQSQDTFAIEPFEKRLLRFLNNDCREIFGTLLNSIHNIFIPEIRRATEHKLDRLMFFGTHAIIQTVTENIFDLAGHRGTRFYLEHFVDGNEPDLKFSTISDDIHEMRNVMAHRWLSKHLHSVAINYQMTEGFRLMADGDLRLNPDVYLRQFESGYRAGGPIWDYDRLVSERQLTTQKYRFLRHWLGLEKGHPIAVAVHGLKDCSSAQEFAAKEAEIKVLVSKEYGLE